VLELGGNGGLPARLERVLKNVSHALDLRPDLVKLVVNSCI
jgi:hypothetical protein